MARNKPQQSSLQAALNLQQRKEQAENRYLEIRQRAERAEEAFASLSALSARWREEAKLEMSAVYATNSWDIAMQASAASNVCSRHADELDAALRAAPLSEPSACESECNPYVSSCGAHFCSFEDMAAHEKTCTALEPTP